jgi:hypothetical protein
MNIVLQGAVRSRKRFPEHSMKRSSLKSVILGATILAAFSAHATIFTLGPGAFVGASSSSFPAGGAVVDSTSVPFSAGVLAGTLNSQAIAGDAANPYGGLTFTYQFTISTSSANGASQLSVSSFGSFFTDVSFNLSGAEVKPFTFSRSNEGGGSGDVIHFGFSPTVFAGQESALLVVQTSAQSFSHTTVAIIDGTAANVDALAPIAVPEPGTVAMLLGGLGAIAWLRRR